MKLFILISFFTLTIFTQSCKTSFRITVKEPATIKLANNIQRFGVISTINNENSPEKTIGMAMGVEQINGNVIAGERAIDGVLRALENSNFLTAERFQLEPFMLTEDGQLKWDVIDSVAKTKNYDGIFQMDELRSSSPVGGSVLANVSGQQSTPLNGTLFITVRLVESKEKHERFSVRYRYNIPISGSTSVIDILNDVVKKREYYRALGFQLGYQAGNLVHPNWVWVNRKFYNKGSKSLKRAKQMIRKGNWDIAERTLLPDTESWKDKVRGRVFYNLALVNEGQGEIDNAIMYAEKSAIETGNKMANEYLNILLIRKRVLDQMEQEKVEQQ